MPILMIAMVPSLSSAAQQIPIVALPGAVFSVPGTGGSKSYLPPIVVVPKGSNAKFTNLDIQGHNIVSDKGKWPDPFLIQTGASEVIPLFGLPAATYGFHCSAHPWMKGKFIIKKL